MCNGKKRKFGRLFEHIVGGKQQLELTIKIKLSKLPSILYEALQCLNQIILHVELTVAAAHFL